jgi:CBS-domain-containing membrane protein
MTCHALITPPPAVLAKSDTVSHAVSLLIAHRFTTLPVTDANGRYAGVFGVKELIALLLPRAARLGDELGDLNFVSDTIADLQARLGSLGKEAVGRHMAAQRSVRPETAMVEALLLLYRGECCLPVVDDAGKLIGLVSATDAVARIAEQG